MKAVVYCNGEQLRGTIFDRHCSHADLYVAADGGAYAFILHGIAPHVIIGDMDSYISVPAVQSEIIFDPDQETNDLEKALNYLLEKGVEHVLVAGATGMRLDHSLKNLSVLAAFSKKFVEIRVIDNYSVHFMAKNKQELSTYPGQAVSLFPMSGVVQGIKTTGLKFPLNNEPLEVGKRDGSSNAAIDEKVEIQFDSGDLLISLAH